MIWFMFLTQKLFALRYWAERRERIMSLLIGWIRICMKTSYYFIRQCTELPDINRCHCVLKVTIWINYVIYNRLAKKCWLSENMKSMFWNHICLFPYRIELLEHYFFQYSLTLSQPVRFLYFFIFCRSLSEQHRKLINFISWRLTGDQRNGVWLMERIIISQLFDGEKTLGCGGLKASVLS